MEWRFDLCVGKKLLERCKQDDSTAACEPSGTPGNAVIQRTAA